MCGLSPTDRTFYFPYNELDVGYLKPGEVGEITIKVEVVSTDKQGATLQKHGAVVVSKPFGQMDLEELKSRIGTVEDEEKPMNDQSGS